MGKATQIATNRHPLGCSATLSSDRVRHLTYTASLFNGGGPKASSITPSAASLAAVTMALASFAASQLISTPPFANCLPS